MVTGCYDDNELNLQNKVASRPKLLLHPSQSEMQITTESNANLQIPSRPALYERRGSALFDSAKPKSSQRRIKQRRYGTVTINKQLLILEESEQSLNLNPPNPDVNDSMHRPISSSTVSTSDSLETLSENHNHRRRRTGCEASNPRDSGVSLAFDNGGYTDCDENNDLT